MNIIYLSQFTDSSGYASAARGYLKALDKYITTTDAEINFRIKSFSVEKGSKLDKVELDLIEKYDIKTEEELESITSGPYLLLWHMPPPFITWGKAKGDHDKDWGAVRKLIDNASRNVNLTVWEADTIPATFNKTYDYYDTAAVIVPSKWNKEIFTKHAPGKNIYLVPHVLDQDIVNPKAFLQIEQFADKFVISSLSQWGERKGFDNLIKAFCMEFGHQKDVVLLIKTYGILMDDFVKKVPLEEQKKQIAAEISSIKRQISLPAGEEDPEKNQPTAPIILVTDILPYEHISDIFDKSDLFALLTRGEGFGLPIAEALMHETPVLVPDQGGHVDFNSPDFHKL